MEIVECPAFQLIKDNNIAIIIPAIDVTTAKSTLLALLI